MSDDSTDDPKSDPAPETDGEKQPTATQDATQTEAKPKRKHRRVPKLPPDVVDPAAGDAAPAPTATQKAAVKPAPKPLTPAQRKARHEAKLKTSKRFARPLAKAINAATTSAFVRNGVDLDWRKATEHNPAWGMVFADIVVTDDDIDVLELPTGEAIAYHLHSLGLESLEQIAAWMELHPITAACVGLAAVLFQHGRHVRDVVKEVERQAAERAKAQAESASGNATPMADSTPHQ